MEVRDHHCGPGVCGPAAMTGTKVKEMEERN